MYVKNKVPTKYLKTRHHKRLKVDHLKIFGFPIFFHVPKEKRTKLDPSRKNGIFFGYSDTSKEYRIYILGH
jgi:hypothetical protein